MRNRAARNPGKIAATVPTSTAAANCMITVSRETPKTGNSVPSLAANHSATGYVANIPATAPASAIASDSPKISAISRTGPKPSAFIVAYSARRSRAVIAMVFAITAMMMKMTRKETTWIATTIASVMATNPSWNAFSVSVSVSAREFLNIWSIAPLTAAARLG